MAMDLAPPSPATAVDEEEAVKAEEEDDEAVVVVGGSGGVCGGDAVVVAAADAEVEGHPYAFHVSGPRNLPQPNWREIIRSSW
jgi:NAD(P)H-hydrate repair Nnr-like enzyme with NAD(P)H-hydrate epimerase domain